MKIWPIVLALAQCLCHAHAELKWDRKDVVLTPSPTDPFADAAFGFINAGKDPVTIEKLESSCDCTTASLPKTTIDPGERSEIVTRFNIGDRRGLQTKTVTVRVKGEAQPIVLSLVVTIPELIRILPPMVIWEKGEAAKTKTISLKAFEGKPVKIASVISSEPNVKVKLETIRVNQEYAIVVTPNSTAKPGFSVLTIFAELNDQKTSLCAYAKVKGKQQ